MNKIVPFKGTYDLVKTIDNYSHIVLYASTFVVIVSFVIKNFTKSLSVEIEYISKANCILIIGYLLTNLIKEYLLFNARRRKRLDFIDNALGSSMTADHTVGYYTNENIAPGIYKLAVNGFENVLFSLSVSKAMFPKTIIINAIILFVFVTSAIYGFNDIVVLIIQLALPAIMLQQIIKLVFFINYLDNVYHKYCSVFNDLKGNKNDARKLPVMISNILEYETTLSWANILLNEKKFDEMNPALSEKWEKIKVEYGINE